MTHPKPTMTGFQLREWMEHRGYTHDEAAKALGVMSSAFDPYLRPSRIVPENLRLAVIGYEAERNQPITGVTE